MWFIILQFMMLTPHSVHALVSSKTGYDTLEMCQSQKRELESDVNKLIKTIFGSTVTFKDAKLECKEIKSGTSI